MTMPSRSFDRVPQLVQPKYRDMDKMMSDAHATWDRMAANMASSACQMPGSAGIPPAEPFTPPVPVQRQPESERGCILIGIIVLVVVIAIVRLIVALARRTRATWRRWAALTNKKKRNSARPTRNSGAVHLLLKLPDAESYP